MVSSLVGVRFGSAEDKKPAADEPSVFVDRFDGDLDWDIRNPADDGYSLSANPGALTMYTHRASIWNANPLPVKDLFLFRDPIDAEQDFEAILHVASFEPKAFYHQVGLIFYESDEQYLKFTVEHDREKNPATILMVNNEQNNKCKSPGAVPEEIDGPFWLRLRRRGLYQLDDSNDGEKFWMVADQEWEPSKDDAVVRIGFLAKKGPGNSSPDIPAIVESFRLKIERP